MSVPFQLEPLNLSDFQNSNGAVQSRFVQNLGKTFSAQGFAVLTSNDLRPETLRDYYSAAAELLCGTPEQRLRSFEFVKDSIERGYVSSPSGSAKPIAIPLRDAPQFLYAAGLEFTFDRRKEPAVMIANDGDWIRLPLPLKVYAPDSSSTEASADFKGRSLKFRLADNGDYLAFAPDDKHGWITGLNHNVYPGEAKKFAASSLAVYQSQTTIGQTVTKALSQFLGDKDGLLENLVANSEGQNIAQHALRVYRYPAVTKSKAYAAPEQTTYLRVGEHRDISLMTILSRSNLPGLQIQAPDSTWQNVRLAEGSFIIMAGETLTHMTRGLQSASGESRQIHSPLHRVVGAPDTMNQDRYTAPFFFNPDLSQTIVNLHDRQPLVVRGITLNPGLRLVHAHMKASTQFANLGFEQFVADYGKLGDRVRETLTSRNVTQAAYIP